jgi:hypothetical protein
MLDPSGATMAPISDTRVLAANPSTAVRKQVSARTIAFESPRL